MSLSVGASAKELLLIGRSLRIAHFSGMPDIPSIVPMMPAELDGLQSLSTRAAHRDVHCLPEVAFAIQQSQIDAGPVRAHVQSEVLAPLGEDDFPPGLPVVWVAVIGGDHVANHLVVSALGRDDLHAVLDQLARVALEERLAVHRPNRHAAVDAVAVVHQVADPVTEGVAGLWQSWREQPEQVRFDLEVDGVPQRRVVWMTGHGRPDLLLEVQVGRLCSAPQIMSECR